MFGYIIINKQEMKFREYEKYRSYYCGLCRQLKEQYGVLGQVTLTYDMTFVVLLLSALYEPQTSEDNCRCIAHPFESHATRRNEFTEYAADMNVLFGCYQCEDDWNDERKLTKKAFADLLQKKADKISRKYPAKVVKIVENMNKLHKYEELKSASIDEAAGCFGEILAEIMAYKKDEWEMDLRQLGFFLGKYIYLLDAFEDREKDKKTGNYNVFVVNPSLEEKAEEVLVLMMAECCKAFERLPIIEDVEILRNILYSGVWFRYQRQKLQDKQKAEKQTDSETEIKKEDEHARSI